MQLSGVLFIFGGTYYVADHNGYQRRVTEDQAEIDRLNAEARAKEEEVIKKFAEKDEQLRKNIGSSAKKTVLTRYNAETNASKYVDIIRQIKEKGCTVEPVQGVENELQHDREQGTGTS